MKVWRLVRIAALLPLPSVAWCASSQAEKMIVPQEQQEVILFALDNSNAIPALASGDTLDNLLNLLEEDQLYRLIVFGGRDEIHLDAPDRYDGTSKYTDFYFVFRKIQDIVQEYPKGTDFKIILVTDGILEPSPNDWADQDLPEGADLKQVAEQRTLDLVRGIGQPLYIMQVGDLVSSVFIREMVRSANGPLVANRYVEELTELFSGDGLILRRFIYDLQPEQGTAQMETIIRRIARPVRYRVELSLVVALMLFIGVLVGVAVRSFPGPGDEEIVELRIDEPTHIAVDRLRSLASHVSSWSWQGLSLVSSTKQAAATMTLVEGNQDIPPDGLDLSELVPTHKTLIELPLSELRPGLEELMKSDVNEDLAYALNLDAVAPHFESARAEEILTTPVSRRRNLDAMDFLRAKTHLLHNPELRDKLIETRVDCLTYGQSAERRSLRIGDSVGIGPYIFRLTDLEQGGRKDYRVRLTYEEAPSPLLLKRLIPRPMQSVLRFRRNHERFVA